MLRTVSVSGTLAGAFRRGRTRRSVYHEGLSSMKAVVALLSAALVFAQSVLKMLPAQSESLSIRCARELRHELEAGVGNLPRWAIQTVFQFPTRLAYSGRSRFPSGQHFAIIGAA